MIVATKLQSIEMDWAGMSDIVLKYVARWKIFNTDVDYRVLDVVDCMSKYASLYYEHTLIDVKVKQVKAGQYGSGIAGWHTDWTNDLQHPNKPEHHLIYSNFCGTEWLGKGGEIVKAGDGEIWKYGRELHRCPRIDRDGVRVLIRMSQVDKLK